MGPEIFLKSIAEGPEMLTKKHVYIAWQKGPELSWINCRGTWMISTINGTKSMKDARTEGRNKFYVSIYLRYSIKITSSNIAKEQ